MHGWGARADKLEALGSELERLGWETLDLDMPGFGLPAPKFAWGLDEYADWVKREAHKKWKEYIVFGHSFGGRIAIKMAISGELRGVVLCAPWGIVKAKWDKKVGVWIFGTIGEIFGISTV